MKTRFTIDEDLDGYQNINPFTNIDDLSDNECSYIFCDNCIRGCHYDSLKSDIIKWCQKLRHGGIIQIVGVEIISLIEKYLYDRDAGCINKIIESSNGIFTINEIKNVLLECGLKIQSLELTNSYYVVEAIRC